MSHRHERKWYLKEMPFFSTNKEGGAKNFTDREEIFQLLKGLKRQRHSPEGAAVRWQLTEWIKLALFWYTSCADRSWLGRQTQKK